MRLPEVRTKAKNLINMVEAIRKLKGDIGTLSDEVASGLEPGTYFLDGFVFEVETHDKKKVLKDIRKVTEL